MNRWDRRIERAGELQKQYPAAAELLAFYSQIAGLQKRIAEAPLPVTPPAADAARIPEPVRPFLGPLLELLERSAPSPLRASVRSLNVPEDWDPADPAALFVTRVLVQPYAERLAQTSTVRQARPQSTMVCPACGEQPVTAVLRPEGEGGKRSLVCSLCFTEWDCRRLLCPHCGEEKESQLPVYTAEQFPHVRIEACETCRVYVKSVDLTRHGLAVPEVDELAAIALDLWAAERGYTKLQMNLFGL